MNDQPAIREIGADDVGQAVDIWRSVGLAFEAEGRDSLESLGAQLGSESTFLLGFYEGDRLVGIALGTDDGRKGWINRVAVVPDRQRSGVGRTLIRACEAMFAQRGIRVVACLVFETNDASKQMFQDAGYALRDDITYLRKDLASKPRPEPDAR